MPRVLVPGNEQETDITADADGSQSFGYRNIGSGGQLRINGVNYGQDVRYPYATYPKPAPASVKVSWEAPAGKIGDNLTTIIVSNPPAVNEPQFSLTTSILIRLEERPRRIIKRLINAQFRSDIRGLLSLAPRIFFFAR